jgi:mannose-6-phosphate isomerase-like protein (cupin superfamily)
MNTVVLEVRSLREAPADAARGMRTRRAEREARISFATPMPRGKTRNGDSAANLGFEAKPIAALRDRTGCWKRKDMARMTSPEQSRVIPLADARSKVPGPQGERSISLFKHGSLDVKLAAPVAPNEQTPHEQDEVYVIIRGRGYFRHAGRCDPFEPGDVLFAQAGIEHRFEDFGDDLLVWVFFYGPSGGETVA